MLAIPATAQTVNTPQIESVSSMASGTAPFGLPFTVGHNSNRLLLVSLVTHQGSVTSVSYGNVALQRETWVHTALNEAAEIWFVYNPPSGTALLSANVSGGDWSAMGAYSLWNAAGPFAAWNWHLTADGGTSNSLSLKLPANGLAIDAVESEAQITPSGAQVTDWSQTGQSFQNAGGSHLAGGSSDGSATFSWLQASGQRGAHVAVAIKPASGNAVLTSTPVSQPTTVPTSPTRTASPTTPSPTRTPTVGPSATPTAPVAAGKLRYRSVDVMKLTKDNVTNQPSDSQIATVVAAAKSMHVSHVAFSIPIDSNSDFVAVGNTPGPRTIEQATVTWANAIHNAGLNVLFRGTLSEFEQGGTVSGCSGGHIVTGIWNFPFDVTGDPASGACAGGLQTQNWWITKIQAQLTTLAQLHAFRSGDIVAPLPEPQSNQNFWDTKWNFLGMNNNPSLYASFFLAAKQAEDAAMAAGGVSGVQTGFTSDNGSMFLSGPGSVGGGVWIPPSYEQAIGTLNVDHYGSDGCGGNPQFSPAEMQCGLNDIYSHYQTPILLQEWADIGGRGPSYVQSMLTSAFLPEIQAGKMIGFNAWDPGCGNPGSYFNCDYSLTPTGQVVASFFQSLS